MYFELFIKCRKFCKIMVGDVFVGGDVLIIV